MSWWVALRCERVQMSSMQMSWLLTMQMSWLLTMQMSWLLTMQMSWLQTQQVVLAADKYVASEEGGLRRFFPGKNDNPYKKYVFWWFGILLG